MLRALRFSAQLGFQVEEETFGAIRRLHASIGRISVERIQSELTKLLISGHPEVMLAVYESGLSSVFLPEWDALFATMQNTAHHCADVGRHTILVLQALPQDKVLRLAGLLHDIGKPISRKTDQKGIDHFVGHPQAGERLAGQIMRRLRWDNATIRRVLVLIRFHDERLVPSPRNARRLAVRAGSEAMERLFLLKRADIAGQSDFHREEKLADVDAMERFYQNSRDRGECLELSGLAIGGAELIKLGAPKGPALGRVLRTLLAEVVDEPDRNTADYLSERALELLK